jgi:hypothetical protein
MLIVAMELQQWVPSTLFSNYKLILTAVSATDVSSWCPCEVTRIFCSTLTKCGVSGVSRQIFVKVPKIQFCDSPLNGSHTAIHAERIS